MIWGKKIIYKQLLIVCASLFCTLAAAQETSLENAAVLAERGREIYFRSASCNVCHGIDAQGLIGPSLAFGPTPYDIAYQFQANPQMEAIGQVLELSDNDLLAVAVFIRSLNNIALADIDVAALFASLDQLDALSERGFKVTDRERRLKEIERFSDVLDNWERRSKPGSLKGNYQVRLVAEFEPGAAKFTPQRGRTYFYENTGTAGTRLLETDEIVRAESAQIVVGDAETGEIVAFNAIPLELRSAVHTTVLSPDGKYVYIIGSKAVDDSRASGPEGSVLSPATWIKADAVTLQPVKQFAVGARVHHAQLFQDRYILIDTFVADTDGLNVFLFDPVSDEIVGGISAADLGGNPYSAWTEGEYIYVLMEAAGYGYGATLRFFGGELTALPPAWVAKIDPVTWEVVREYPHPGYRADWICFDRHGEKMFVASTGTSNLSKIDIETGKIEWTQATGAGPYGCNLNVDDTEVWVADKGEATGHIGRTVTVIDAATGAPKGTVFSAYAVDHVLLSPGGEDFWLTSNGEGSIYVFDAASRAKKRVIRMPNGGDPHGLVWVHYDDNGSSSVIRDQGGFHNGVDPRNGRPHSF